MNMTEQEFRNEMLYSVTMGRVKLMLERGLITMDEYSMINEKMKAKYHPISDGLVSENTLLCVRNRA